MQKKSFWKSKPVTISFAMIASIFGFLFLDSSVTGNTILNDRYAFNALALIGLLLTICSLILALYSLRKK
ncbi:MAG: hypothetical protein AABX30_03660 [Nanoarchaeota archaeon]